VPVVSSWVEDDHERNKARLHYMNALSAFKDLVLETAICRMIGSGHCSDIRHQRWSGIVWWLTATLACICPV
jgi:hypothetical protein